MGWALRVPSGTRWPWLRSSPPCPHMVQAEQDSPPQTTPLQASVPVNCASSRPLSRGPPAFPGVRQREGRAWQRALGATLPSPDPGLLATPPCPHLGGERLPACASWEQPRSPLPVVLLAFTYLHPKNRVTPVMADSMCHLARLQCPGICSSTV